MIGYIEGKLLGRHTDRVLVLANQVGYEIHLPGIVMTELDDRALGDDVRLFIYHHQTERQPRPVLIGFRTEKQKAFFQQFISVDAIGPIKAVKALQVPIADVARAIENRDVAQLARLKGIGKRTAEKIIAALRGRLDRYLVQPAQPHVTRLALENGFIEEVMSVLVNQMGHKTTEARRLIERAIDKNPGIASAEACIDAIYRHEP